MRLVFTPPADHAAGLLTLPWSEPLAEWQDARLAEIGALGISRHVVRFVRDDGVLYALKELSERLARREYRLLRALAELGIPAAEVIGVAVDRGGPGTKPDDSDAILVTKFLTFATTYRSVFSVPRGTQPIDGLLDALVELLVRLHLSGFFWGDCSLSNTLFRYDAGILDAYLIDAETSEQHPELTAGQRNWDVELAIERVGGELLDLQAAGLLSADVDPVEIAGEFRKRHESLWTELTREKILRPGDLQYKISERLRRLNELGFDAEEVELTSSDGGSRLRLKTRVAESGHYWFIVLARFWYDLARPWPDRLRSGLTATWARPRPDSIWSARAAAFTRCDLRGDHAPGDRLAASQLPEPRRGPDNDAEPAAADIPAVDADVDSCELLAAQLPQVLEMRDASHRSKVRSCSREPPRSNQYLGRGQDAHHDSMSTYGAR